MKFKEFVAWCNERACDGCWGMITAMVCIDVIADIRKVPFWRREKVWKEKYEADILEDIVTPINQMIEEMEGQ